MPQILVVFTTNFDLDLGNISVHRSKEEAIKHTLERSAEIACRNEPFQSLEEVNEYIVHNMFLTTSFKVDFFKINDDLSIETSDLWNSQKIYFCDRNGSEWVWIPNETRVVLNVQSELDDPQSGYPAFSLEEAVNYIHENY